jgi:hypothetical protein
MTEEQRQRKREKDRERIAKKRAEQKAASLDMQTPTEEVEKAPETAMQVPELSLFDYHKRRMDREARL